MPVLGQRIGQVLAAGEIAVDPPATSRCCATTTTSSPSGPAPSTCRWPSWWTGSGTGWRTGGSATSELNYRRFFDVDTLAAVRVEDPEVFDATHGLLLDLVDAGSWTACGSTTRTASPTRAATCAGWPTRPAARGSSWRRSSRARRRCRRTGRAPGPPATTPSPRVGGLFVEPPRPVRCRPRWSDFAGERPRPAARLRPRGRPAPSARSSRHSLRRDAPADRPAGRHLPRRHPAARPHPARPGGRSSSCWWRWTGTGRTSSRASRRRRRVGRWSSAAADVAPRAAAGGGARRRSTSSRDLVLGREAGSAGRAATRPRRAHRAVPADLRPGDGEGRGGHRVLPLAPAGRAQRGRRRPGPVRRRRPRSSTRSANRLQAHWPATMTTLSTHDTKRSEDARARLSVLSEMPVEWGAAVRGWHAASAPLRRPVLTDPPSTCSGRCWWPRGPVAAGRSPRSGCSVPREGDARGQAAHLVDRGRTPPYERAVAAFAAACSRDESCSRRPRVLRSTADLGAGGGARPEARAADDAGRARRLPGHRARRPVAGRPGQPAAGRPGARAPAPGPAGPRARRPEHVDDEKLLVTSRALRLRRDHPDAFVGEGAGYMPVATTSGNAVAFSRNGSDGARGRHRRHPARSRAGRARRVGRAHGGAARGPLDRRADRPHGRRRAGRADRDVLVDLPVALLVRD